MKKILRFLTNTVVIVQMIFAASVVILTISNDAAQPDLYAAMQRSRELLREQCDAEKELLKTHMNTQCWVRCGN